MNADPKNGRRYQREQILEEGQLTWGGKTLTVDVLDLSTDQDRGEIRGFGVLVPTFLSVKEECLLQLDVTRYSGQYRCETVYCLDTGFGYRVGLSTQKTVG